MAQSMEFYNLGDQCIPVQIRKSGRSDKEKYRIGIGVDGRVKVSVPASGSSDTARKFLVQQSEWILEKRQSVADALKLDSDWPDGIRVLFFGRWIPVESTQNGATIHLGSHVFTTHDHHSGLKARVHHLLNSQARAFLPPECDSLAKKHGLPYNKVSVRNQKTRWGSCSNQKNISLNWRLIQCPDWIREYVILHELTHTRHLNHSLRYWRCLRKKFRRVREAEEWLASHAFLLKSDFR